ncbi:MAG: glycerol-3-phosphate 1-O-acyltransferase PlsY [Deltaproteobacteria bacterium]|nr:glycerol-3-phosphate 1-O-acyltransferase PlsY [Deltaproteobacteria bacterium]
MIVDILLLLAAYLIGSVPTGVLLARTAGVDPRQVGSGNIGATNVARSAGTRLGLFTLAGDAIKGALPVLLAPAVSDTPWVSAATGLAAIAGHLFSVFLRFRGGKGVATAAGAFLVLAPLATIASVAVFAATAYAFRLVSLASMAAAGALPLLAMALGTSSAVAVAAWVTAMAVIARHRENIRRIAAGREPRFGARGPA